MKAVEQFEAAVRKRSLQEQEQLREIETGKDDMRKGLNSEATSAESATQIFSQQFAFHVNAFTIDSKLPTSATFNICAFLSIRFINPLNAVPGPSSMNRVKPSASK